MPSPKLVRLALGAACLLPAACATTSYSRSSVATLPPGLKGKAGADARVEIAGLKVRLESLDYAKRDAVIPPLGLRLVFDPRELGYSFDPAQVKLRDASGATWSPVACASGYHVVVAGSSFEVRFEVTLPPETRLELELGGLARGRTRLDPVKLALVRRDGRSIDRIYWLEAIGYGMAIVTYPSGGM